MASIVIISGPDQGRSVSLSDRPATIGRMTGCGVQLTDSLVSRQHCRVTLRADGNSAEVCDLGSANGTWLNGQLVHGEVELGEGDEIAVGNTTLRFSTSEVPAPATKPAPRIPAWRRTAMVGE